MPPIGLLAMLIALDIVQIPMFYWLYENSHKVLTKLPARVARFFEKSHTPAALSRWTSSLGGFGVMVLAAMPTLGGGMWSGIFLAYGMQLDRRISYAWLTLGSAVSYLALYWITDGVISTIRYFSPA